MPWFWIVGCFSVCFELYIKTRWNKYFQEQKKIWKWNNSELFMDHKPQSLEQAHEHTHRVKGLWRLRGLSLGISKSSHTSPGQLFTQRTWLEVKGRFASGRTRGLDAMYCSLGLFSFSLWATWESISLFQLTWTILFQHFFTVRACTLYWCWL